VALDHPLFNERFYRVSCYPCQCEDKEYLTSNMVPRSGINPFGVSSADLLPCNRFNFFGFVYRRHFSPSSFPRRSSTSFSLDRVSFLNESWAGLSRSLARTKYGRVSLRTLETFEGRRSYLELSIFKPREELKLSPELRGLNRRDIRGRCDKRTRYRIER